MRKPIAVIVSDVHYSLNTLQLADAAMRQAINKSNCLQVPLIVAGDLHDTKANLRGECVKAMLNTFGSLKLACYILVGNHDRINERSPEHSLEFLRALSEVTIVDQPTRFRPGVFLLPYYHDTDALQVDMKVCKEQGFATTLIMHQGVMNTNSGHYIQDKSALPKEAFADFRVISGHYHTAQDIKCGRPRRGAVGLFSYIGNPYTLNFGEANDPPKGFVVLYDDGILERVPTDMRRHVILEYAAEELDYLFYSEQGRKVAHHDDILWIKVTGSQSRLGQFSKGQVAEWLCRSDFKLDLIPTDAPSLEAKTEKMTGAEILDALIDNEADTTEEKSALKSLWRETLENPIR